MEGILNAGLGLQNVRTYLAGAGVLATNGFNTDKAASVMIGSASDKSLVASSVAQSNRTGQCKVLAAIWTLSQLFQRTKPLPIGIDF